ncbi:MAG TPA: hypothetical protein VGY56_01445 [Verrucomicrobiae bacterium]|nr:hypothetical protein [Verrucomicrobiae bacterium]
MLFQSQNRRTSEWLHRCYGSATEKASGHTEFRVHPSRSKRIIEEMKAAGFEVAAS